MRICDDLSAVFCRRPKAMAVVRGGEKYPGICGRVVFYSTDSAVIVRAEIVGLPKGNEACDHSVYAFHIHEGTMCGDGDDAFAATGGHFNPAGCPHPYHAGDLPPLFAANGKALLAFLTDRLTVPEILGRAVIIHDRPDDFTTQPSGNAGEKIACGLIMQY